MLSIGNKKFMNLQEAVGWLLENNALPFQSTANYAGNTEIAMSTLINPSPAKVRVGSLIFFADSKVSTVIGVTSNSFIVSDQYNDLVDDIVYVSNVAINASGHLIVTLSNGNTIDAGLIKQVSNFSIDGSQHLIVNYNDGTNTDLGAIFSGNISISGNLTVSGGISGNAITGNSIIESMSGYSYENNNPNFTPSFAGVVKNGNKLTFALAGKINMAEVTSLNTIGLFKIPSNIGAKLYPNANNHLAYILTPCVQNLYVYPSCMTLMNKNDDANVDIRMLTGDLSANTDYEIRVEFTFLLSNNLAS